MGEREPGKLPDRNAEGIKTQEITDFFVALADLSSAGCCQLNSCADMLTVSSAAELKL